MIIDPTQQTYKANYKLLTGAIVPRPIAFVSTVSAEGIRNIAPFSFFNGVCSNPPTIMFSLTIRTTDGKEKDTLVNIRATKEFVVNIVSEDFAGQMVAAATEYPSETDEFEMTGLTPVPSEKVAPPRLGEARVSFECRLNQIVEIGDGTPGCGFIVIGTVVLYHIRDEVYRDGRILLEKLQPIGRLAGHNYCRVSDIFQIVRKIKPDSK
ncbi:MAG: flavin reductase family protein [FCB group bacterium]|nr:flavin reductase family protein [FCB group bacterium]